MTFASAVRLVEPTTYAVSGAGAVWLDPVNIVDSSDTTYGRVGLAPLGDESANLKLTGFDFSWFNAALYDVTGVTLVIKAWGQSSQASYAECFLIDENGIDFGAAITTAVIEDLEEFRTFETVVSIPNATFSSANFGVRIKVASNGTGAPTFRLYKVEMILQFARKRTATGYGLQIFDAAGNEKLSRSGTFVRHVDMRHHDGGWVGTETVPDFDDTKGVMFFAGHWEKYHSQNGIQRGHDENWNNGHIHLRGHMMEPPSIFWDNSTKVLTVSLGGNYPLPTGWDTSGDMQCGWSVIFLHYR